jgi:hypothetical protein
VNESGVGAVFEVVCHHCQTDWPEWLAIAKFSYNNKFQSSTWVLPFYANYGYNPHMGFELRRAMKVQAVEDFVQ